MWGALLGGRSVAAPPAEDGTLAYAQNCVRDVLRHRAEGLDASALVEGMAARLQLYSAQPLTDEQASAETLAFLAAANKRSSAGAGAATATAHVAVIAAAMPDVFYVREGRSYVLVDRYAVARRLEAADRAHALRAPYIIATLVERAKTHVRERGLAAPMRVMDISDYEFGAWNAGADSGAGGCGGGATRTVGAYCAALGWTCFATAGKKAGEAAQLWARLGGDK